MELLKEKIKEKGFTQQEVATEMRFNRSNLNEKLSGLREFSLPQARKLSQILGLTDAEILQIFFKRGGKEE